jgi:hypothetical protein
MKMQSNDNIINHIKTQNIMKRIISMLACALLVVCSCQKDPLPGLSFETANYVMGADEALTVKIVTTDAPAVDLAVGFTVAGSAVSGSDYQLSSESFVIKAGETTGELTVTPLKNLGSNLNITMTLMLPSGYAAGDVLSTTIALASKEKAAYSFAVAESKLVSEVDVTLNLIGLESGANFVAGGVYEFPFVLDASSTATAADYEVKGGKTSFVFEKGSKSATVTFVAKGEVEGKKTLVVKIDETAVKAAYGERFSAGVNAESTVVITNGIIFSDLVGKWAYASAPILDDPEADIWTLYAMISEMGDGDMNEDFTKLVIPGFPTGTSSDVLEFKYVDGKASLIPSGAGTVLSYFRECEVSDFTQTTYTWYYYDGEMGRTYNVTDIALSKANVNYSAATPSEKPAKIKVCLSEDGKTLNVFINEYTPTDFFANSYGFWSMMEMWADNSFYYDLYFTFTKVE